MNEIDFADVLCDIPQQEVSQLKLLKQLQFLAQLANRFGFYDAEEYIKWVVELPLADHWKPPGVK